MTENNLLSSKALKKCAIGIAGFDEITFGGLPQGHLTLIAGGAGSGARFEIQIPPDAWRLVDE